MSPRPDQRAVRERALARKSWPVKKFTLGKEPADDLLDITTPSQRIEMVAELTEQAWSLSGRPFPDYERSEIPIGRRRIGEASDEDPSSS